MINTCQFVGKKGQKMWAFAFHNHQFLELESMVFLHDLHHYLGFRKLGMINPVKIRTTEKICLKIK